MAQGEWWTAPRASAPVDAVVTLPGSKSLTNRALLIAAVADGPSTVLGALRSRDTLLMAEALRALGASVDSSGEDWRVEPIALGADAGAGEVAVDVGLAGTVMRFVPPIAALTAKTVSFVGDERMKDRPVDEVLDALAQVGVEVDGHAVPFTVHGRGHVAGGGVEIDASGSSQFVSALLLAAARFDLGAVVMHVGEEPVPSMPHIRMTVEQLREHGVVVNDDSPDRWSVSPGPIRALDRRIEPDLSNAAPFVMLAALTGGRVVVRHWPRATTQAGDALRDLLSRMGCTVAFAEDGLAVTGPEGGRAGLLGIDADLHDVGELTPALAALCALASTPSKLTGVAHIRGHETDRLAALATELGGLGADVEELPDGLVIRPAALHAGRWRTYADHRMAHAGVVLAAAVDGVEVEDIETTSKTFTDFAPFWEGLFA